MSDPIFALPRHDYTSYQDMYRLIALSGFPTCYIDEIDPASDNAYILTILNGEVPAGGYPGARARLILTDYEYHLDGLPPLANVEFWTADAWYAEQIGARYVPLGSHPGLCPELTPKTDLYDVAFIGYINGVHRRSALRQQLIERGIKVSPTGAWGGERHTLLRSSAAYLCVHQHDHAPTIAPLRMVVAAAYGLPVITEACADAGIFAPYIWQAPYQTLAARTQELIGSWQDSLMPLGVELHQRLCHDLTFRKSVESAL